MVQYRRGGGEGVYQTVKCNPFRHLAQVKIRYYILQATIPWLVLFYFWKTFMTFWSKISHPSILRRKCKCWMKTIYWHDQGNQVKSVAPLFHTILTNQRTRCWESKSQFITVLLSSPRWPGEPDDFIGLRGHYGKWVIISRWKISPHSKMVCDIRVLIMMPPTCRYQGSLETSHWLTDCDATLSLAVLAW